MSSYRNQSIDLHSKSILTKSNLKYFTFDIFDNIRLRFAKILMVSRNIHTLSFFIQKFENLDIHKNFWVSWKQAILWVFWPVKFPQCKINILTIIVRLLLFDLQTTFKQIVSTARRALFEVYRHVCKIYALFKLSIYKRIVNNIS